MSTRRRTTAAVGVLLAVAAAGCSSGGGDQPRTADEKKAVTNISASLVKSSSGSSSLAFSPKQGDCVAGHMVDGIGLPALTKAGLIKPDLSVGQQVSGLTLSQPDAKKAVDAFFSCAPIVRSMQKEITKSTDAKSAACLKEKLDEPAIRSVYQALFTGNPKKSQTELMSTVQGCVSGSSSPR